MNHSRLLVFNETQIKRTAETLIFQVKTRVGRAYQNNSLCSKKETAEGVQILILNSGLNMIVM